ncbi:MAG: 4-hydroxy-3-methylbut-2-enyl diphosphate reductase [Actinomycetia bacterium]|nr:4-hydroxy-3-methylbut-2-enyl diphosphate reductase [Actinomycetes bacterium]
MKVTLASQAGYCYGVERALRMTDEAVRSQKTPIFTLGPIIHNPQVVESFKALGVEPVVSLDKAEKGTIIVRTHGVDPVIIDKASKKGLSIIDATCPFVANAQQRAAELVEGGYSLIIVGEKEHPEVIGILAHAKGQAVVVEKVEDIPKGLRGKAIGVVIQTTQPLGNFQQIVAGLAALATELKVFNTICGATSRRQHSAKKLAEKVNVMIVVGGKNSANTSRLAQICEATGTLTHHIETSKELKATWFKKVDTVGLTAGASTPEWLLQEVVEAIKEFN